MTLRFQRRWQRARQRSRSPRTVMMNQIGTDENGLMNLQEFAAFCSGDADPYKASEAGGEKELREAFEFYDQDHEGKISAAECLGEGCTVEDCAGMIKSVDSSADGFVSFNEFRKMMTSNK